MISEETYRGKTVFVVTLSKMCRTSGEAYDTLVQARKEGWDVDHADFKPALEEAIEDDWSLTPRRCAVDPEECEACE